MRISNHIASAVGNLSQHKQLSHDSLVTNDFGQITPVLAMPLLPRDNFSINSNCFARCAPLIFPTYGRCRVVTNFHSVQYSQLWRDFDIFVTGDRYRGTEAINFPVVSYTVLSAPFTQDDYSYVGDADADNHDLVVYDASGSVSYRFLTSRGRYIRKVLVGLGYPFINVVDNRPASNPSSSRQVVFSALPLLAFFKVYNDFYESRQYSQNSVIRQFLSEAYVGKIGSFWSSSDPIDGQTTISVIGLSNLWTNLLLLFPSDFFTSAQSYSNLVGGSRTLPTLFANHGSNTGSSSSYFDVINNTTQTFQSNIFQQSPSADNLISQASSSHRIVENLENLVRRFNLVGNREIDRIRAMFGIRPSVQRNQYSVFHGGFSSPLQIQDVTSTSANFTDFNYLGSYAGKGIVSNGNHVSVKSDDFGFLIGLSFIQVNPLYQPGLNREVLKTSMWSYYNPDFDHGYAQAVAVGEVQSDFSFAENLVRVFGYQNAYDEYRQQVSRVNGDFVDNDLLAWTFLRENVGDVAQSNNVIYQSAPGSNPPSESYNAFQRIFVDGSGRDHFYLYYSFDINALRVVRTSSSSFDLGVGDVSTSNNPVVS